MKLLGSKSSPAASEDDNNNQRKKRADNRTAASSNGEADGPPRSVEFPSQDNYAVNSQDDADPQELNGANSASAEIARSAAAPPASQKHEKRRSRSLDMISSATEAAASFASGGHDSAVVDADDDATRPMTNKTAEEKTNLHMGRHSSSFYSDDDDESGHGVSGRHNSILVTSTGDDGGGDGASKPRNLSADHIHALLDVGSSSDRDYASSGTKPINYKPFDGHTSTGNIEMASTSCTLDNKGGGNNTSNPSVSGSSGKGALHMSMMRRRPSLGMNIPLPFKSASTGEVPSNVTFSGSGGGDGGEIAGPANLRRSSNPDDISIQSGLNIKATFQKEHKAVRKFKIIVVLVLVAAAVAVTVLVYKTTSATENDDYQTQYKDYADKFITNFHHLQVMRQWAAYTTAGMYTGRSLNNYGPAGGNPWPNVTLPDYADQMRGALVLAHATTIEFCPLFDNEPATRTGWESYAVDNEASVLHVPSWAMMSHGGGHGGGEDGHDMDMSGNDHAEISDAHAAGHHMGTSGEHDGAGANGSGMMDEEHGAMHTETDMEVHTLPSGIMSGVDMAMGHDTMDSHMDPDMAEAVEIATTDAVPSLEQETRRLRGRNAGYGQRFLHGHDGASNSSPNEHHEMTDAGHGGMGGDEHVEHPRRPIEEGIHTMGGPGVMVDESSDSGEMPFLAPAWQIFPLMGNEGRLMYNEYADRHRRRGIDTMLATKRAALTQVLYGYADHHHFYGEPSSVLMYPVFDSFESENKIVGAVSITFSWMAVFWNILPENVRGVIAVLETSTGQKTSFRVDGKFGTFLGEGDMHDPKYDDMKRSSSVYRVYGEENNVKEMKGHHLMRWLQGDAVHSDGHGHEDLNAHVHEDGLTDGEHIDLFHPSHFSV